MTLIEPVERPNRETLIIAQAWLTLAQDYLTDPQDKAACAAVAKWIESEIEEERLREFAAKYGIGVDEVKDAIRNG